MNLDKPKPEAKAKPEPKTKPKDDPKKAEKKPRTYNRKPKPESVSNDDHVPAKRIRESKAIQAVAEHELSRLMPIVEKEIYFISRYQGGIKRITGPLLEVVKNTFKSI